MGPSSIPFLQRPRLSLAIRLANRLGTWLRRLGFRSGDLSEKTICDKAKRQTGLSDWGDERFRVPLKALVDSYENDPGLTFVGRAIAQGMVVHLLANRLRIHHNLTQQPDILNGTIRRPLFVVGLPRTGTTLLQNLLSQDQAARPLYFWESMSPSPPPDPATRDADPRIRQAEKLVAGLTRAVPALPMIHEMNPRGPDECLGLLFNTFVTPFFRGNVSCYREWLARISDEEVVASYREYRQQLLLLQWKMRGDHWVLKCPSHLFGLGALLATFPDACIVQTHRDLAQAVPSLCSLSTALDGLSYETVDLEAIGQRNLTVVEQLMVGGLKARQSADASRFYDLHYPDLVKDPVTAVRRIYHHFEYAYSDTLEDKLKGYLAANRQHKHGVHQYRLEDFRLDRDVLGRRFAEYYERFGISPEHSSNTLK
jgi:hypothetical protein